MYIQKTSYILVIVLMLFIPANAVKSQQTDIQPVTDTIQIDEVVFSANNARESKREVSQQIEVLNSKSIQFLQAPTTADMLSGSGFVSVQKSQQGGGSPVIRGFEASRILLIVDGVRMNNLIYRAGHLQNVITIDNNILDRVEIMYGPSSTVYGSDALGGVIHLYTKSPILAADSQPAVISSNAFIRYGSASNEMKGSFNFNYGTRRFASLTSVTYSKYGDLKGGENQNPFYSSSYGERPFYVERMQGKDSLMANSDRFKQISSGYTQYDFLQKFLFKQNEKISHGLNLQYSTSTDIPRYDRLTDPSDNGLKNSQWFYGPQNRLLAAYTIDYFNASTFFHAVHFGLNYQFIEESRHNRGFENNFLQHRTEKVNVYGLSLNAERFAGKHTLRFGVDGQFNTLLSRAVRENIVDGEHSALDTRYPDGNNYMIKSAAYVSHSLRFNPELILVDGLRLGFSALHSSFIDTTFYQFPYTEVNQRMPVYSGSLGVINNPSDKWKLSAIISTGFRVPNVDDLSKIFDSSPGTVIVPNPNLIAEKTINTDLSVTRYFGNRSTWENTVYFTQFFDAIITDDFLFNGEDSILYQGTLSKVLASQNKREAYLYGFSSNLSAFCGRFFEIKTMLNYTYGRIKTDSLDAPLDHIPPVSLRLGLNYLNKQFQAGFDMIYNGWKHLKDYSLNGEDNEQYATPQGMPAWLVANLRVSYSPISNLSLQTGIENILDTQYRSFASGINAPGRNIYVAVRFSY